MTTGGRGRRARVGVDPRPAPPRPVVVVVHPEDWIHDAVHYGRSKLVHGGVRRGGVFGECGRRVVEHPARHRCSLAPEVLQLASEGLHLAPVRVAPGRGGLRPARGDSLLVPHGRRLEDLTLDLAANLPREPRQGSFGPRRLAHGVPRRAEGPRRGRGGRTSGGGHYIFTAPRFFKLLARSRARVRENPRCHAGCVSLRPVPLSRGDCPVERAAPDCGGGGPATSLSKIVDCVKPRPFFRCVRLPDLKLNTPTSTEHEDERPHP